MNHRITYRIPYLFSADPARWAWLKDARLAAALDADSPQEKLALRRQWLAFSEKTITDLFALAEKCIHAQNPRTAVTGEPAPQGYVRYRLPELPPGPLPSWHSDTRFPKPVRRMSGSFQFDNRKTAIILTKTLQIELMEGLDYGLEKRLG